MTITLNLEGEAIDTNTKIIIREPPSKVKSFTSLGYRIEHLIYPRTNMAMFAGFIVMVNVGEEHLIPATWTYFGNAIGGTKKYGDLVKADPIIIESSRHAVMKYWVTKKLNHEGKYSGAIGYFKVHYYDDNSFKIEIENDPQTLSK